MDFIKEARNFLLSYALIVGLSSAVLGNPSINFNEKSGVTEQLISRILYLSRQMAFDSTVFIRINFTNRLLNDILGNISYQKSDLGMHQFNIYINRKYAASQHLLTIAHELIHAKQFIKEDLIQQSDYLVSWKKEQIIDVRYVAHDDRPWEREAARHAGSLVRKTLREIKKMY